MSDMPRLPNILLIVSDQHRYDCTGYSRDYPVRTPHIDRLAEGGVWFDRAYTPIPLCGPARQAFLSGRRPEALGTLWNVGSTLKIPAMEPTEYVWPRALQRAGYRNAYIGKWHVHPEHGATAYGYDAYVPTAAYSAYRQSHFPDVVMEKDWMGAVDPVPLEAARTHWLADRAIEYLQDYTADAATPWHIRLDFPEPHLPCQPVQAFAERYDPAAIPPWRSFGDTLEGKPYIQQQQLLNWNLEHHTWQDWAAAVARYYAIVEQMDDAIGKVLNRLDELGATQNTLVIYTSDHGDMGGGHRMMDKHYVMYEDVVRIPLALRWPGRIQPGRTCSRWVSHFLDLPPTLLEVIGRPVPSDFHGRSLLPLLRGEPAPGWREEVVATYNGQQFGLYTQRMLRTEEWKYVWNATDIDELYDLKRDTDELHNVIADPAHREKIADFRRRLYHILVREGDGMMKGEWIRDQLLQSRKR